MLSCKLQIRRCKKGIVAIAHLASVTVLQMIQLFPAFPDLLCDCANSVLGALPDPSPICVVHRLHRLFEHPVPPVFGHLCQPNGHLARSRLLFRLLGLVEVCEDVALLTKKGGLCCAVLLMQREGEIENGRGEGEASELQSR